jgi:hypothetical protein
MDLLKSHEWAYIETVYKESRYHLLQCGKLTVSKPHDNGIAGTVLTEDLTEWVVASPQTKAKVIGYAHIWSRS